MTYFDFLETRWVETSKSLQVKAKEVTVPNQARFNAVASLIEISRNILKWVFMVTTLVAFVAIKLHLKKAPSFKSSIPEPVKPDLKVVAEVPESVASQPPNTNLQD